MDTIFALSSGAPPAAIAVLRISGPAAGETLEALTGTLPPPRRAVLATLRNPAGEELDRSLVLWFPGPASATGEDLAELHLHGGRAVVSAVEIALAERPGVRRAQPGEFTRRAFSNGLLDLAEAEGLADLLSAETEFQRRAALAASGGVLSRKVEQWRERLLLLSAQLEAVLDFEDEEDVRTLPLAFAADLAALADALAKALEAPSAVILREGYRVALAGPPNSGKSTLFNALVADEAAITAPVPGTTRDVLTRPVAIEGVAFLFIDMAGLRNDEDAGLIEALGIARARSEIERADLVLWLGPEGAGPDGAWEIEAQTDRSALPHPKARPQYRLSAVSGSGLDDLARGLTAHAMADMPRPGQAAFSRRQRELIQQAHVALTEASSVADPLCQAEALRQARLAFDRIVGRTSTEEVLDVVFGRFCIGK